MATGGQETAPGEGGCGQDEGGEDGSLGEDGQGKSLVYSRLHPL